MFIYNYETSNEMWNDSGSKVISSSATSVISLACWSELLQSVLDPSDKLTQNGSNVFSFMHKANNIHHCCTYTPVHRSLSFRLQFLPRQTTSLRLQVTLQLPILIYNTSFLSHARLFDFCFVLSDSESFRRPTCDGVANSNPNEESLPPDRLRSLYQVVLLNCKLHWLFSDRW